jgi:predicted lysophospholipase L1 biosynthesis ABC-type transport system permease subunit
MKRYLLLLVAILLGALVGAVIGGFTSFFAVLSLRQSGLLEMKELAVWPDFLVLAFGVLLGGAIVGALTWRSIHED